MAEIAKTPAAQKLDHMMECYKNGYSDIEICREMNWTMKQFEENIRRSTVLADLVEMGRVMSRAWWYTAGRTNLNNKGFNTPLWGFNMKNRFGWADKVEQTTSELDDSNLSEDQLQAKLRKLQTAMLKQAQLDDASILNQTSGLS